MKILGYVFITIIVGVGLAEFNPRNTPKWVVWLEIGVISVVIGFHETTQKKEQEEREERLALKKHEATLRFKAAMRQSRKRGVLEVGHQDDSTRVPREFLKSYHTPVREPEVKASGG